MKKYAILPLLVLLVGWTTTTIYSRHKAEAIFWEQVEVYNMIKAMPADLLALGSNPSSTGSWKAFFENLEEESASTTPNSEHFSYNPGFLKSKAASRLEHGETGAFIELEHTIFHSFIGKNRIGSSRIVTKPVKHHWSDDPVTRMAQNISGDSLFEITTDINLRGDINSKVIFHGVEIDDKLLKVTLQPSTSIVNFYSNGDVFIDASTGYHSINAIKKKKQLVLSPIIFKYESNAVGDRLKNISASLKQDSIRYIDKTQPIDHQLTELANILFSSNNDMEAQYPQERTTLNIKSVRSSWIPASSLHLTHFSSGFSKQELLLQIENRGFSEAQIKRLEESWDKTNAFTGNAYHFNLPAFPRQVVNAKTQNTLRLGSPTGDGVINLHVEYKGDTQSHSSPVKNYADVLKFFDVHLTARIDKNNYSLISQISNDPTLAPFFLVGDKWISSDIRFNNNNLTINRTPAYLNTEIRQYIEAPIEILATQDDY